MRYKHGLRNTRQYRIWLQMKNRCYNPKTKRFVDYGARGITVCDEWKNDFQAFYDWSMSHGYSDDLTIDRINNDKGYSPDNCRWASSLVQANNSRHCNMITWHGETHSLSEWSRILGIARHNLTNRILHYGYSVDRAFTEPVGKYQGIERGKQR